MVLQFIPKEDQQEVLRPLAKELRRLIKLRFGTNSAVARALGWPSTNDVQRIAGQGTQGFDYIKATQLMVACGLTPNTGASLVGLYEENDNGNLTADEKVLVDLHRSLINQERKDMLLLTNQVMVQTWNQQDDESLKTQEEDRLLRFGPSQPLKNKRKVREASEE